MSGTWSQRTIELIRAAAEEDLGPAGDITAGLLPDGDRAVRARVVPRAAGVICGLGLGPELCREFAARLEAELRFEPGRRGGAGEPPVVDGDSVAAGEAVASVAGPLAAVLTVERTLLNFLTRMSGVATLTRRFVDAARTANPQVQVLDTRKTLPGWRELDKYAVRCGGGVNHRFGLFDAVLIKDNHLAGLPPHRLAARLSELLSEIRGRPGFVAVEVDSLEQLEHALKVVGVDVFLLDNFEPPQIRSAVALRDRAGLRGRVQLEVSGGVTLETIGAIAETGVDRISVGALTHSAAALDIGLDV